MTVPAPVLVLVVLLALIVGAAVGAGAHALVVGRREAARASSGRDRAATDAAELGAARARAEELSAQVAEMRERATSDADVLQALAPLRSGLADVGRQVQLLERERAARAAALDEQLAAARRADAELVAATGELGRALRAGGSRGQWGEVTLRRVVESAGMLAHVDFDTQRTAGSIAGSRSAARPDLVVHLPGGRTLAVDAKVPMDAYLEASAIDPGARGADAERRERLLATHAKALRGHVDALASRGYHAELPGSPELVVLFLPSEPLLGAALEADPGLLEHALARGVAPTSPSSLLALLRAVASVWSGEKAADEAGELLELGRTLADRLATVAGHLGRVGSSLRSAVGHYNSAVGSIEGRLLVTARSLESLGAKDLELAPIDADDAQVRAFTAPELAASDVEDGAAQVRAVRGERAG
ncbi:DNA recombination protein RmuC [Georgenia sp. Z1344]|uniref:DNA recombination protein RmuC n=1 Tax=Georgenia sp. Z1344 TaxID=3416706 RepID=UPI003CE88A4C